MLLLQEKLAPPSFRGYHCPALSALPCPALPWSCLTAFSACELRNDNERKKKAIEWAALAGFF